MEEIGIMDELEIPEYNILKKPINLKIACMKL